MTWFAFQGYNSINLAGSQEKEAVSLGFHGYATQAQAEANRNSVNFFQKGPLNLLETDYTKAVQEGAQPGGPNDITTPVGAAKAAAAGSGIPNPLSGLDAIGSFFGTLTEASTWMRVGEVVLGIILLAVGVSRMTKAVPVATKVAKTVGMAAL
jgi:hypothetical protein